MAYFIDTYFDTKDGKKVNVRVLDRIGSFNRKIYVNGRYIGYDLGNNDNYVYRKW